MSRDDTLSCGCFLIALGLSMVVYVLASAKPATPGSPLQHVPEMPPPLIRGPR